MGRAVKLKRQRKRQQQQQRLNSLPSFPNEYEPWRDFERQSNQPIYDLIDWVKDHWSTVPQFVKYFTLHEANKIAKETLSLLLTSVSKNSAQDVSLELGISEHLTILLFFHSQSLSIETKIVDNFSPTIFDLPGQFRLPSYPPSI